ncbi:T9SS type A sorting domain-containing protein [Flavobacteriaceae bacterium LMO-SS05]
MKKTTSENLSKRLTKYGALTAAFAGVIDANGQHIIYTDLGLDVVDATTYQLNIDNNGTPEFKFSQVGYSLRVIPNFSSAAILGSSSSYIVYPFALNSGAIISNLQNTWFPGDGFYQSMNFNNCSFVGGNSNWCDPTTDKYLGLRFNISGQTHYGWARVSVYQLPGTGDYPNSGWAISGYAYEEDANTPILAGDTTYVLGTDENSLANTVRIVALQKSIALYNLPESTNYTLYSISGQSILEGKTNQNTYVIEANTIASGLYVLEIRDNASHAVLKKKVVL